MASIIEKQAKEIVVEVGDLIDLGLVNEVIKQSGKISDFELSKQTLQNIAKWCLNGQDNKEIQHNLELDNKEWGLLLKMCPTLLLIMQKSRQYASVLLAGTMYQTAIGGRKIKKQVPMKIKDYDDNGKVIGEHIEICEIEEIEPPNPYLLKYLAEHKMDEQFGNATDKTDTREMRSVIENMTEEDRKALEFIKK